MFMQVVKTRLCIYPLLINILLLFASCSEDNPLAPSKKELPPLEPSLEQMLTYFPLAEGKQWKYEYSYNSSSYYDNHWDVIENRSHNFKGTFLLAVLKVYRTNQRDYEGTFFKLSATFEIEKEQYIHRRTCYQNFPDIPPPCSSFDSSYTRENFTVSREYYLMLRDWSLWYVKSAAPSGSTPVDSTTMMMESPCDTLGGPGRVNLKMFNYPGIDLFPVMDKKYTIVVPYATGYYTLYANIIKTKGVTSIGGYGGESWHQKGWGLSVKYKLIDE